MIERLLEIKKIRADRADKAVQRQEYRVANVAAELQKAERSVEDYHVWRQEEEERRFAKAKQQTVLLKELETLRQEIALLREREAELKQRVAEVKVTLEQERTLLKQKQQEALQAIKPKKNSFSCNNKKSRNNRANNSTKKNSSKKSFALSILSKGSSCALNQVRIPQVRSLIHHNLQCRLTIMLCFNRVLSVRSRKTQTKPNHSQMKPTIKRL